MNNRGKSDNIQKSRSWIWYVMVILIIEKIIQHVFVTFAFYLDFGGIRSSVSVNGDLLMISGAMVAILFMLSLWGMISEKNWAINLVIVLSLIDIIGEFIAQGKMDIMITVSFIVAIIMFVLTSFYRQKRHKQAT